MAQFDGKIDLSNDFLFGFISQHDSNLFLTTVAFCSEHRAIGYAKEHSIVPEYRYLIIDRCNGNKIVWEKVSA